MEIESKFYDEISALERQYESQFQPLYAKVDFYGKFQYVLNEINGIFISF